MAIKQKAENRQEKPLQENTNAKTKKQAKLRRFLIWTVSLLVLGNVLLFIVIFFELPMGKAAQEWANNIPVIKALIPDPATEKNSQAEPGNEWKEKYLNSTAKVKEKEAEIIALTKDLKESSKDLKATQSELDDIKQENLELQAELDTEKTEAVKEQMKQLASLYKTLPPRKAAEMLSSMSLEDAAITLSQLGTAQQSSIFNNMKDAKKAAQLSLLIKEIAGLNTSDLVLLKAQIHQIALQQENPTQLLADTISKMSSEQAAGIVKSMMSSNSYTTTDLLKNIDTSVRAQILAEIQKTDANMAAQIAASLNR